MNYRGGQAQVALKDLVRRLRLDSTDAERLLWRHLRDRRLGGFILDFFCAQRHVAIEADGGQHFSEAGIERDERRRQYLDAMGVRVLRFSNTEILNETEAVLEAILHALRGLPAP